MKKQPDDIALEPYLQSMVIVLSWSFTSYGLRRPHKIVESKDVRNVEGAE